MSRENKHLSYVRLDVFSSRPLEGNQLAVFLDANELSDQEMQALAREMNLAETTFVFPRSEELERERGTRVRIFTVAEELPFAGHPTLGTAFALRGSSGAKEVRLELKVGTIPVHFEDVPDQAVFGEMTQRDPEFGLRHDREAIARAAGLSYGDIDPSLPVQTVSTGLPFTIVPLRGLEAIRRLRLDMRSSAEYLKQCGGGFFYFVCRETVDSSARLHARMIFYGGEDPATGSAAGCTAAWMVAHGVAQPEERVLIEQGIEIRRPSRIFVRASRRDDRVVNVRAGGNCVELARGEFFL